MATGLRLPALVLSAALAGCDRIPERAERTTSAAPIDTVVKRVTRVVRDAAAVQRATGLVSARRADEALDSTLAIRVLDNRGGELAGARVRWFLRNGAEGARLHVVSARTDSLGLSRATFIPGRSASTQIVSAEVNGVGRIDMPFVVPVADIRVLMPSQRIWSGETAVAGATLTDDRGTELPGGRVSWATTDTAVLQVSAADSARALVRGALAGAADLVAWIGDARGRVRVVVRPVLAGAILTLDGSAPEVHLEITVDGRSAMIPVERGTFTERVAVSDEPEVDVRVTSPGDPRFHAVHVRVATGRDLQRLRLVLVPTSWRIEEGSYAGREIAIDARAAMRRVAGRAPFWRAAPVSGRGLKRILGWRESHLPIRIAFGHAQTGQRISAEDSTAFWRIARQMERDLGGSFFAPATVTEESDQGVVPVRIDAHSAEGHTFISWTQTGDASEGELRFRAASTLRDPHVVTHELLHLLGFGHSTSWPSVSAPSGDREGRLTPEDVAYAQLALRLRRTDAWPGLPMPGQ